VQSGVSLQARLKRGVARIVDISTWRCRIVYLKVSGTATSGTLCVRLRNLVWSGKVKKTKAEKKISKVMTEYNKGKLHSGSKKGPTVTNPKQALAIALSEAKVKKK
jgi:hypothetical protein